MFGLSPDRLCASFFNLTLAIRHHPSILHPSVHPCQTLAHCAGLKGRPTSAPARASPPPSPSRSLSSAAGLSYGNSLGHESPLCGCAQVHPITIHPLSFSPSFLIFSLSPLPPALDLMPGFHFKAFPGNHGAVGRLPCRYKAWPLIGPAGAAPHAPVPPRQGRKRRSAPRLRLYGGLGVLASSVSALSSSGLLWLKYCFTHQRRLGY